ncbi:hypothetical protein YT1_1599 [Rhodococcus ruber]|nr:hypothetical protein YT1_1599 [Rhodococcus ruber]
MVLRRFRHVVHPFRHPAGPRGHRKTPGTTRGGLRSAYPGRRRARPRVRLRAWRHARITDA